MSTYYTFRISFCNESYSPSPDEIRERAFDLMANVLGLTGKDMFTWAYHTVNSRGYPTTPHIHVHYKDHGRVSKATIRKRVATHAEQEHSVYGGVKGVKLYSIKDFTDEALKDEKRFFRYVFKESHVAGLEELWGNEYFCENDLETQMLLATDEYDRERDKLLEKDKKDAEKSTTYDKFLAYLGKNDLSPQNQKDIAMELVKFYVQEKMACNANTMRGYVNTFLLSNNLITYSEWIEKNLM